MNYWPQFRSPLVWDVFAVSTYATISLVFWFVGLIPDLATLRDRATSVGEAYLRLLAWAGAARPHWHRYETTTCCSRDWRRRWCFGAHGGELRFCRRHRAGLAHDNFPAVLCGGCNLYLRICDGALFGDSDPAIYGVEGHHHRCGIWTTPPR